MLNFQISLLFLFFPLLFCEVNYMWYGGLNKSDTALIYLADVPHPGKFSSENFPGPSKGYVGIQINNTHFLSIGGKNEAYWSLNQIWMLRWSGNDTEKMTYEWLCGRPQSDDINVFATQSYSANNTFWGVYYAVGWLLNEQEAVFMQGLGDDFSFNHYEAAIWIVHLESFLLRYVENATYNSAGIYGTKNVYNSKNRISGRYGHFGVKVSAGEAVVFGGYGVMGLYAGCLNDVFIVNLSDFNIKWVSGNSTELNMNGEYGDLMKGPEDPLKYPGGRYWGTYWKSPTSNSMMVFGGYAFDIVSNTAAHMNDLWRFNASSNNWSWLFGYQYNSVRSAISGYTYNTGQYIGARLSCSAVPLSNGDVVLIGGYGYSVLYYGCLTEVWSYRESENLWKYNGGGYFLNSNPNHGSLGVFDSVINRPGGRSQMGGWRINDQVLGIYGGRGDDDFSTVGSLSDVLQVSLTSCYDVSSMKSSKVCFGTGVCVDNDVCQCSAASNISHSLPDCSNSCFNVDMDSSSVCNGHGNCLYSTLCNCSSSLYSGNDCSKWKCYSYDKYDPLVCNGHGMCVDHDSCKCFDIQYYGVACSNTYFAETLGITLGVIISVLVFSCVVLVIIVVSVLVITLLRNRLKKFESIEDVDILLEEQRLGKGQAHLQINKNLFKVKWGDIKMIKVLGEGGGKASVYLATWKGLSVALKMFQVDDLDEDKYKTFENEVQILASVHYPTILRFLGAVMENKRIGYLMEYCPLGDLQQFLCQRREEMKQRQQQIFYSRKNLGESQGYPLSEKMRMLREICSAVEYLHSVNIIHRDLKPNNVLVAENEETRLMDFGLSKSMGEKEATSSSNKTKRVGTSYFMAPEVLTGVYDSKCDVFSFGILMFVVITELWEPYGPSMHIENIVAKDPNFRPKFPPNFENIDLKELIEILWIHDPAKRPPFSEITTKLKELEKKYAAPEGEDQLEMMAKEIRILKDERNRKEQLVQQMTSEINSLRKEMSEYKTIKRNSINFLPSKTIVSVENNAQNSLDIFSDSKGNEKIRKDNKALFKENKISQRKSENFTSVNIMQNKSLNNNENKTNKKQNIALPPSAIPPSRPHTDINKKM